MTARSRPGTSHRLVPEIRIVSILRRASLPFGTGALKAKKLFQAAQQTIRLRGGFCLCGAVSCLSRERVLHLVPLGRGFGGRRRPRDRALDGFLRRLVIVF